MSQPRSPSSCPTLDVILLDMLGLTGKQSSAPQAAGQTCCHHAQRHRSRSCCSRCLSCGVLCDCSCPGMSCASQVPASSASPRLRGSPAFYWVSAYSVYAVVLWPVMTRTHYTETPCSPCSEACQSAPEVKDGRRGSVAPPPPPKLLAQAWQLQVRIPPPQRKQCNKEMAPNATKPAPLTQAFFRWAS